MKHEYRSSEDLMAHRKTLELILESLPEGIVAHDRERRITYLNRAAEAITGWPRNDLLGKECHEAFGAPFCGQHCPFCEEKSAFIVNLKFPLNIVTKQGEPKQVSMSVSSITDEKGQIIGHVGLLKDITSLSGWKDWKGGDTYFGIVGKNSQHGASL